MRGVGWVVCFAVGCGGAGAAGGPRQAPPHASAPATRDDGTRAPRVEATADDPCRVLDVAAVLACSALDGAAPANGWDEEIRDASAAVSAARQRRAAARRGGGADFTMAARELGPDEQRVLNAGRHLLCAASQPWADSAVAYAVARAFYEANHFREAAALFDAIVRDLPRGEHAEYAANLALDSVNIQHTQARDAQRDPSVCFETLRTWTGEYATTFGCDAAAAPAEICETLARLRCDIVGREAERNVREGDLALASRLYESIHTTHCGDRGDEALHNAAELAERAGDAPRAGRLRQQLRDAYPQSALVVPP